MSFRKKLQQSLKDRAIHQHRKNPILFVCSISSTKVLKAQNAEVKHVCTEKTEHGDRAVYLTTVMNPKHDARIELFCQTENYQQASELVWDGSQKCWVKRQFTLASNLFRADQFTWNFFPSAEYNCVSDSEFYGIGLMEKFAATQDECVADFQKHITHVKLS